MPCVVQVFSWSLDLRRILGFINLSGVAFILLFILEENGSAYRPNQIGFAGANLLLYWACSALVGYLRGDRRLLLELQWPCIIVKEGCLDELTRVILGQLSPIHALEINQILWYYWCILITVPLINQSVTILTKTQAKIDKRLRTHFLLLEFISQVICWLAFIRHHLVSLAVRFKTSRYGKLVNLACRPFLC